MDGERLDGWKEIATRLKKSEKTARRWEELGMPVYRRPSDKIKRRGPVWAFTSEIDAWVNDSVHKSEDESDEEMASVPAPAVSAEIPAIPTETQAVPSSPIASRRIGWPTLVPVVVITLAALGFILSPPETVQVVGNPVRLAPSASPKPPLLADRNYYYWQQQDPAQGHFFMVRANAQGAVERLNFPDLNPDPGVVAPDGSAMLLRNIEGYKDRDQPLFLQPLPSGKAIRLGEVNAYDSAWLPGGDRIIFSPLRSVYEASPQGLVRRKLFDVPGRAYGFRWHPDGRRLRFTVYDSTLGTYRLWETMALGSAPQLMDLGPAQHPQQCCGSWSPDGKWYFFQALTDGFWQIFVRDERWPSWRKPAARQLTFGQVNYGSPVISPDGARMVTLSRFQKSEVVAWNRAEGRWLPLLADVPAATAAVSKDGRWLAYTQTPDHSLWRCELPGCTQRRQLTQGPAQVTMPRWSPDSQFIACMTRQPGRRYRATLISATTGESKFLIDSGTEEADPDWSPSGEEVVFGAPPNPDTGADRALRIKSLASGAVRIVPGAEGYHSPRWSPDGRYLAAVSAKTRELAFLDLRNGTWTTVPEAKGGYLNWTARGDRLIMLSSLGIKKPVVIEVVPPGRQVRTAASLEGLRQPPYSFGEWVGIGPGYVPLALRDLGSEEVLSWRFEKALHP